MCETCGCDAGETQPAAVGQGAGGWMPALSVLRQVQDVLSRELEIESEAVTLRSKLGADVWWDSLNHLHILLVLAEAFDFSLTAELARRLTSIPKILAFLEVEAPASER